MLFKNRISLVKRLKANDEKAFDEIFDEMHLKIFSYCLKFTRSKEAAEEIVQDVFVRVWKKRHELDASLSIDSLLYKISRDYCCNYLKKIARDLSFKDAFHKESMRHYSFTEDEICYTEYYDLAERAINNLSPQRQLIFRKNKFEGKSYMEIASEMGISPNTVKVQLVKATKILKQYLGSMVNNVLFVAILLTQIPTFQY